MMPEINTLYLRTHTGRTEITEKTCGLTQSERQVLILVDGITPYGSLVQKLQRLKAERIARAIKTLQDKGLISEVLIPVEGQTAEELDMHVVERFLHQDPMDPVTIISFDPEEDFGEPSGGGEASVFPAAPAAAPAVPVLEEWMAVPPAQASSREAAPAAAIESESDIVTDEQVAELAMQVRERQHARPQPPHSAMHIGVMAQAGHPLQAEEVTWRRWEYWLIGTGLMLIVGGTMLR